MNKQDGNNVECTIYFYYEDNLITPLEYGAKVEFLLPLHQIEIPDGCSGLS